MVDCNESQNSTLSEDERGQKFRAQIVVNDGTLGGENKGKMWIGGDGALGENEKETERPRGRRKE